MTKIGFLIALHNHQPCDNFGWVFEDAYDKSYEPFISVLEKYPRVKVALHYSGSLLEWFNKNRPGFLKRIEALVKKRQVELLTGGFFEPVLPVIPDRDKRGQIRLLTDFIKNHFEYIPSGVWVTERVWEKDLADVFLGLNLQYTVLDENHLKQAGLSQEGIHKYYELRNGFKVFAADKRLRYIIPFGSLADVVKYFQKISAKTENTCMVFADDGEKFGFWPHTYGWVYKKKWLKNFFEYLSDDNTPVESVSFSDALHRFDSGGIVNIPSASYSEMMEWSRGSFNNFFKIYPEADRMRSRMLYVSDMVYSANTHGMSTSKQKLVLRGAEEELYRAQSGCAYWHGIFGGLYLNHLRRGVYQHLIGAQNLLQNLSVERPVYLKTHDVDGDSKKEVIIGNKCLEVYIKPDNQGAIFELDNKIKCANMINTIRRIREPYHSKVSEKKRVNLRELRAEISNDRYVNIYNVLGVKGRNLKRFLIYDDHPKSSFVDYFVFDNPGIRDFVNSDYKKFVAVNGNPYRTSNVIDKDFITFVLEKEESFEFRKEHFFIYIKKKITVTHSPEVCVEYTLRNLSKEKIKAVFATEFNWSLRNKRFLKNRDFKNTDTLSVKDEYTGSELKCSFNSKVRLWAIPVYTLNESESGVVKAYQYLSVLAQRPINLDKDERVRFSVVVSLV